MTGERHNPFSPPLAVAPIFPKEAARREVRRPVSAWIVMALVTLFLVSVAGGMLHGLWLLASGAVAVRSIATSVFGMAIGIGACVLAVLAIRAIHGGRPWARWVGLALIVAIGLFSILQDGTTYRNDAERAGGYVARFIVFPVLFTWWAWAFAFTAKARAYFAPRAAGSA